MSPWGWIGVVIGVLALLAAAFVAHELIADALLKRRLRRLTAQQKGQDQQWRAQATADELRSRDEAVRAGQRLDRLREANPREYEAARQRQAWEQKTEALRRDPREREKWRDALLGLPVTRKVGESSYREWPVVREVKTRDNLDGLVDFLIDDAEANAQAPFRLDNECLQAVRDTATATHRQRIYRIGNGVWQYHVEDEARN
jgi:hypothetical protein